MKRYGFNYGAMARDKKNHYQETWRQLRAKCRKFLSIPEQSAQFMGMLKNNLGIPYLF